MPSAPAFIKSHWTRQALLKEQEDKGRPRGQLPGSYIADLAGLRKSIALCFSCQRKFNAKSHGYDGPVEVAGIRWVWSDCDGCRNPYTKCSLFLSEKQR